MKTHVIKIKSIATAALFYKKKKFSQVLGIIF